MRDDEEWYQETKDRLLNASVELDRKNKSDDIVIGNAMWELEMAMIALRGRQEAIYDEAEEQKRMLEDGDESISV